MELIIKHSEFFKNEEPLFSIEDLISNIINNGVEFIYLQIINDDNSVEPWTIYNYYNGVEGNIIYHMQRIYSTDVEYTIINKNSKRAKQLLLENQGVTAVDEDFLKQL